MRTLFSDSILFERLKKYFEQSILFLTRVILKLRSGQLQTSPTFVLFQLFQTRDSNRSFCPKPGDIAKFYEFQNKKCNCFNEQKIYRMSSTCFT